MKLSNKAKQLLNAFAKQLASDLVTGRVLSDAAKEANASIEDDASYALVRSKGKSGKVTSKDVREAIEVAAECVVDDMDLDSLFEIVSCAVCPKIEAKVVSRLHVAGKVERRYRREVETSKVFGRQEFYTQVSSKVVQ